ncbi:cilia- and flagella-associated protein 90 [Alosa pseudoharengus]|uniref:cilia- and flagella-associated protein 90 n=1 Tax=Alosa pseudoharengus TaxID=34774 RepID=UPI003F88A5DC
MDLLSQAETKPLSTLSVFSFIPSRRSEPKEMTYFNFTNPRESTRPLPVLSSSEYGRRLPPPSNQSGRQFAQVNIIQAEFFRKNGITRSVEEGYGPVVPV